MIDSLKRAVGVSNEPSPDISDFDELDAGIDETLFVLKNERRRRVIAYVVANDDGSGIRLDTLSEEIAARENGSDISPHQVTCEQRKRVYIGLYQSHLPKLEEVGVIDKEERTNRVFANDQTYAINRILETILQVAGGENQ